MAPRQNSAYLPVICKALRDLENDDGVTTDELFKFIKPRLSKINHHKGSKYSILGVCVALRQGVLSGKIKVKPETYYLSDMSRRTKDKRDHSPSDTASSSSYSMEDENQPSCSKKRRRSHRNRSCSSCDRHSSKKHKEERKDKKTSEDNHEENRASESADNEKSEDNESSAHTPPPDPEPVTDESNNEENAQ